VATNNGDGGVFGGSLNKTGSESGSTDDVEGGDTEQVLGVEDTGFLEGSSDNRDGGVDGVGDDEDVGVWGNTSNSGSEVTDDGGVGLRLVR